MFIFDDFSLFIQKSFWSKNFSVTPVTSLNKYLLRISQVVNQLTKSVPNLQNFSEKRLNESAGWYGDVIDSEVSQTDVLHPCGNYVGISLYLHQNSFCVGKILSILDARMTILSNNFIQFLLNLFLDLKKIKFVLLKLQVKDPKIMELEYNLRQAICTFNILSTPYYMSFC